MRNERRSSTNKKRKKFSIRLLITFIIYEFIIAAITTPLLVFYGPFQNVKRTIVGTAMATFTHQYIATTFLSKADIEKLIKSGGASSNESENLSQIQVSHTSDKDIERYDIPSKKFDGYILEIKDPTRIKIGYTKKIGEVGQRTSEIAAENGAVAAINGGGFTDRSPANGKLWAGTGAYPEGIVISDGKLVYNDVKSNTTRINVTAFTKEGKLIVGDHTINDLKKENVVEAVSFRNTLVVNGKPAIVDDEGLNPRTAIGQKLDGTIIMLVIDGRKGLKPGASLKETQNILIQQGAYNASNLDGGSSSTMYLDGEVINNPCDWNGERTIATALYVKP